VAVSLLTVLPTTAHAAESITVTGTAVSPSGKPIAGEAVCLDDQWDVECPVKTDESGKYQVVAEQYYPRFSSTPRWPELSIGTTWSDSIWQPTQVEYSPTETEPVTVMQRRGVVKGQVRKGARAVSGVQICADSYGYDRSVAPGTPLSGSICRRTSRNGKYRLPLAEYGHLFIWDKGYVPRKNAASLSGALKRVRPGDRLDTRVIRVNRSRPMTVLGSTGQPGARVCVTGGAAGRVVQECSESATADYKVEIRVWQPARKPLKRATLKAAVAPAATGPGQTVENLGGSLQAGTKLSVRPGRSSRLSWGAMRVDAAGVITQALCLDSSSQTPPSGVGNWTAWKQYCEFLYAPGFYTSPQFKGPGVPLFFLDRRTFKVGYLKGGAPAWVGGDGSWESARVYEVRPGELTAAVL